MLVSMAQEAGARTISDTDMRKPTRRRQAIDSQLLATGQDVNMMNTEPTQQCDVYSIDTEDMPCVGYRERRGQFDVLMVRTESGEVYITSRV